MNDLLARLVAVAVGGAVGSVARYGATLACVRLLGDRFGWGTLGVNVAGCFALGIVAHHAARLGPTGHAALGAGLLGGLTTFSTFGLETFRHLERGETGLALANVGLNMLVGLAAVAAGIAAARGLGG
ncbi:MAG: fluoride efflux transporter FluC [Lacipirellulaceae bacterium]